MKDKEKDNKKHTHSQESEENNYNRCEYCGRIIEDKNDTGTLCYRCYMKEYYDTEDIID